MRILLSEKKPKMAYVLAENNIDQKCLRVLFNNGMIRGAFAFWNGEGDLPKEWIPLAGAIQVRPTAICAIGSSQPISDMSREEKITEFKRKTELENIAKEEAENLAETTKEFSFLKDDVPF